MTVFKTTDEQKIRLASIVTEMDKQGLSSSFVVSCMTLADEDQGAFELMDLWSRLGPGNDRDEVIADLQEMVDEAAELPSVPLRKPYLRFEQLDDVVDRIGKDKKRLRELVDKHGGVTVVAQRAGMHQSALSRLLNSASMPRRTTLYRIANALDLPETDIVVEFVR